MALGATIFKVNIHISDMDRHYYQQHQLTLAQHPSETDERLMVRLVAFALFANESLIFGEGIGDDAAADLLQKDLTGNILLWIAVGLPDEHRIKKACTKADKVVILRFFRN